MSLTRRIAPTTLVVATLVLAMADDHLVNMTGQVTVFWGRNKDEGSLREASDTGMYTMVIMSFLDVYGSGSYHLNLSSHPHASVGDDIMHCQANGVLVSLAIGGDNSLPTVQSAHDLSDYLWNAYLGGSKTGVARPLGDAWLEGVDLFLEHGGPAEHYEALAKELAARGGPGTRTSTTTTTKLLHLTATTHCAIPDLSVGTALAMGAFERIHVRFYDEDEDCSIRLERQWEKWTAAYPGSRVYYGLLASEEQYAEGIWIYPKDLYYGVMPVIQTAANYGIVMIWDRYYDTRSNYSSYVKYWA